MQESYISSLEDGLGSPRKVRNTACALLMRIFHQIKVGQPLANRKKDVQTNRPSSVWGYRIRRRIKQLETFYLFQTNKNKNCRYLIRKLVPQIPNPQICGLKFSFRFANLPLMLQFADLRLADHIFLRFADPIIFCGRTVLLSQIIIKGTRTRLLLEFIQ